MTVLNHSVIIHPPGFYIVGFQTFPFVSVYFIFLAFVYAVTVLFNTLLICIIASNHCLHTPKFMAIANLAVIDLLLSSCLIPSMIKVFLLKDNFIPFNLCLVQMYVYYAIATMESYALAVLAYDRLVTICFPMRHHSINTLQSMTWIVAVSWCLGVGLPIFSVSIMTRLSFCNSVTVFSYFCDYAPVFRLACNDYSLQWSVASVSSMVLLTVPFSFIVLSYISILVIVFRMKSLDSRKKALATCVEHVILVAGFYIPILTIFIIGLYLRIFNQEHRVISLSLASCIPPCINPIVYSFKTEEIKQRLFALARKKKIHSQRRRSRS